MKKRAGIRERGTRGVRFARDSCSTVSFSDSPSDQLKSDNLVMFAWCNMVQPPKCRGWKGLVFVPPFLGSTFYGSLFGSRTLNLPHLEIVAGLWLWILESVKRKSNDCNETFC